VKKRHVFLLLPVLLVVFFAWRNWPLLKSHSEQDQCTFGTDSTALYDGLRAEADSYLAKHGKVGLPGYSPESAQKFGDEVLEQLRAFAMARKTPTEKWAAVHALLRAYGMDFDVNGPRGKGKLKPDTVVLSARYIVLLPKLNWLCPLCYVFPEAAFRFRLRNRGDGVYDQITGGLRIKRFNPKWAPIYYQRFHQICPTVTK
jgi:hypothetical protein